VLQKYRVEFALEWIYPVNLSRPDGLMKNGSMPDGTGAGSAMVGATVTAMAKVGI
jgi:hypothetical protein